MVQYEKKKSINIDFHWAKGTMFLFLIILFFNFRFYISYNEMDIMPYAKSIFNNMWLEKDWYLNLKIPYRYFFSYPVGFFANTFGFVKTTFIGRLVSYIFIAYALNVLIRSIKSKSHNSLFYFSIIIFFNTFPSGNGAGEWMVGGFETKVFAYGFSILSLSAFLLNQHKKGLLFAGLSLSFHLLVGIYNLFCLIPVLLLYQRETKSYFLKILKSLPIFIFAGIVGIYAIIYQLFFIENDINNLGWDIYVNIRVPRHTLPNFFPLNTWIYFTLFTLINLFFFFKSKKKELKILSSYALFSIIISLIGITIFFLLGTGHYLKYYFFRFSDIMLPLITIINITIFIINILETKYPKHSNKLKYVFIIIALFIMVPKINNFVSNFIYKSQQIREKTSSDVLMADWVKKNTTKNKIFITQPLNSYFYINYERSMFVSWKHSPQNNKDIIEWYNRLKALNKGKDFKTIGEIKPNYLNLTEKEILDISKEYPNVDYVLMPQPTELNFPILFKTDKNILYTIRNKTYIE